MNRIIPNEFYAYQNDRALGDNYEHLKLATKPISVRLPEEVDTWVRENGTAWLRNFLCNVYFATEQNND